MVFMRKAKLHLGLLGFLVICYICIFSVQPSMKQRFPSFKLSQSSSRLRLDDSSQDSHLITAEARSIVGKLVRAPLFQNASDSWAQPTLLNLSNFSWTVPNLNTCKDSLKAPKVKLMVILVLSPRHNFLSRSLVRKSYGSLPRYKKWFIKVIFLLGEPDTSSLHTSQADFGDNERKLLEENARYNDLLIGSFLDNDGHITYKSLMGFKWILNYCQGAALVLKTDDEVFIDILRWLDWRTEDLSKRRSKLPQLYCNQWPQNQIYSSRFYKGNVTLKPEELPVFCSGIAYGITVELVRKLYSVSVGKFNELEDVFVTGYLMRDAKIKFKLQPVVRNIDGEITTDKIKYGPMCRKSLWSRRREFGAATLLEKDRYFDNNMMCLWHKTLIDGNMTMLLLG